MNGSFFGLAGFAALLTVVMSIVLHNYRKSIILPVCIGSVLVFSLIVLSMCFYNVKHAIACLKYDHVIVIDWNLRASCPMQIDERRVILSEDYCNGGQHSYRTVIMAWNDENSKDSYDCLVKGN